MSRTTETKEAKKARINTLLEIDREYAEKGRAAYKTTTLEQRRAFVAAWNAGENFKRAYKSAGITLDAALEIFRRNRRVEKLPNGERREYIIDAEDVK